MNKLIIILMILSASTTMARVKGMKDLKGDWGAGGGNALVCFKSDSSIKLTSENAGIIPDSVLGDIERIEMYDLVEAKLRRGLSQEVPEIIEIKPDEPIYDYINAMGKRYQRRVRYFNDIVRAAVDIIPEDNIRFTSLGIEQQNDIANVLLPNGRCLISTMAAQVNLGNHFKLIIDERLFNHPLHSRQSRATLILHEVLYAFLREEFNHTHSAVARELVGLLITYHQNITESSVAKIIYDLDIVLLDINIYDPSTFNLLGQFRDFDERFRPFLLASNFGVLHESLYELMQIDLQRFNSRFEQGQGFKAFYDRVLNLARSDNFGFEGDDKASLKNMIYMFKLIPANSSHHEQWMDLREYILKATKPHMEIYNKDLLAYPNKIKKELESESRRSGGSYYDTYPLKYESAFNAVAMNYLKSGNFIHFLDLIYKKDSFNDILYSLLNKYYYYRNPNSAIVGSLKFDRPIPRRVE